jgi:hypothetical protein
MTDLEQRARELADCLPWSMEVAKERFIPMVVESYRSLLAPVEEALRVEHEAALVEAREADNLRSALTESKREVERLIEKWQKDRVDLMPLAPGYTYKNRVDDPEWVKAKAAIIAGLAENATLRQEVEDQTSRAEKAVAENYALRQEVEQQKQSIIGWMNMVGSLRRQVEEQAGKLAEAEKARKEANPWDSEKRAMAAEKDRDTALRDLAFEREERLDYGHLMRSLAESRAEVERVRQDHLAQAKVDGETITRLVEQRDAALSRAEAAEQERDEFSRQLVWRQSDGERKLREHIDEARLIAARSGFCYYCQASEGAAHAEFCKATPTPPESEAGCGTCGTYTPGCPSCHPESEARPSGESQ